MKAKAKKRKEPDARYEAFRAQWERANPWNMTAVQACLMGRTQWVQVESRKADGAEGYKIDHARDPDAFPAPNWPKRTLNDLVTVTFNGRMIDRHDHPALLRLVGAKQNLT
ncbi:hypothetical protein [Bradyrhizobium sp. Ash2021]|uniref:hypothetical protein n=1 Tax=Bradyrhizobium sp. Ash2021 TaxID=2954771 RepID=UPI0028166FCE|nr:hypothetical protein [Bradyrhizobium sp. Ash2021]WMT76067.1 hypothetical protein NL528_06700 [Bradyrhizobium sp. Ash2021]